MQGLVREMCSSWMMLKMYVMKILLMIYTLEEYPKLLPWMSLASISFMCVSNLILY